MRLILATKALSLFGGSESYLITVAEQLQRLGHDVLAYTLEVGEAAETARDRGVRVLSDRTELPGDVGGTLAQDAGTAYELATLYPDAARVYVAHSTFWEPQRPPQLEDICHAVVVLNDRVRRQCEALATSPRIVRLRQPVDLLRFGRLPTALTRANRVLALGNDWSGAHYRTLVDACGELGLELDNIGMYGRISATPELEISEADIVVGVGRCIIEAMAAGRAAYVYGVGGSDGWVTPDSYPLLEASGFAGVATNKALDVARLRVDLEQFDPAMGALNRDLAVRHHNIGPHAAGLVQLFRGIQPSRPRDGAPLAELARLSRIQWQLEVRAGQYAGQSKYLAKERDRRREERDRWHAEYERTAKQLRELHDAYNRLLATRRWRLAQLIAKPLDLLRAFAERVRSRRG